MFGFVEKCFPHPLLFIGISNMARMAGPFLCPITPIVGQFNIRGHGPKHLLLNKPLFFSRSVSMGFEPKPMDPVDFKSISLGHVMRFGKPTVFHSFTSFGVSGDIH